MYSNRMMVLPCCHFGWMRSTLASLQVFWCDVDHVTAGLLEARAVSFLAAGRGECIAQDIRFNCRLKKEHPATLWVLGSQ